MRPPRCAGLVQPEEGHRLAKLAREVWPRRAIVELGSHTGLSTVWLARGARGAHITAVDPWGDPRPASQDDPLSLGTGDATLAAFLANLAREDVAAHITPLRALSTAVAPLWVQPVGLLFVDAVHEYWAVAADLRAWLPHVPVGGWVALHDYTTDPAHPYAGVAQAAAEVLSPEAWQPGRLVGSLWSARRIM